MKIKWPDLGKFWKRPTFWMIVAVIGVFIGFVAAEKADAGTLLEVAPVAFIGGDTQLDNVVLVSATQRFAQKYDVGILLLLDAGNRDVGAANRGFQLTRTAIYKNFEVGLGYTWWGNAGPAWDTDSTFNLHVGYRFGRGAARIRHWSTGGSSGFNRGLDVPTIGYEVGPQ